MNKVVLMGLGIILILIAFAAFSFRPVVPGPVQAQPASYDDLLQVDSPLPGAEVTSPVTIKGKARGQWYFEASFPIKLYDANGKLLAQLPARAQGDWMTTEYVPFSATFAFESDTATGTLVLQNDNPSGLPANQKTVSVPLSFVNAFSTDGNVTRSNPGQEPDVWYLVYERPGAPALSMPLDLNAVAAPHIDLTPGERVRVTGTIKGGTLAVHSIIPVPAGSTAIKLFYYDPARDQGAGGPQCSAAGLVAVDRVIPRTATPLKDAITLLLKGALSADEKASGITSEFPLTGVALASSTIQNGVVRLSFDDPQHTTSGGSCRVAILRAEIEATATQFPSVQSVQLLPEDLFQP